MYDVQKAFGIVGTVKRKVEDVVGFVIVVEMLVAGRGEEGQKNLVFRIVLFYLLNNGLPLFKLAV